MTPILKRFLPSRFSFKHLATDAILLLASLYLSLWLRLGETRLDEHIETLNLLAAGFVLIRLVVFLAFGVYRSMWRYISTPDAITLASAILTSTPLMVSLTYIVPTWGYLPRSLFVIDALMSMALLMSVRLVRRRLFERGRYGSNSGTRRTGNPLGKLLIYGAGQNGLLLAQRMRNDASLDRELIGFIDDDPQKQNKVIQGLPVMGSHGELDELLLRSGCTELIVAITHPSSDVMRDIVVACRKHRVRLQRIAHFDETKIMNTGEALFRGVELKDLLNRPSAEIDLPSVRKTLEGKVVLVTGAGGSIGSELARQIARFAPAKLLLLDHAEFCLFEIDRELRPDAQDFSRVQPLLVDIKDYEAVHQVFARYKPDVVYHAAAYKHVHLVEANIASAVINNVEGTWNLLRASEIHQVERFVQISSDKAVNPVGAMGATKRVCELLTSQVGFQTNQLYSSVRFGNVLGSSGSLIPLLKTQIESGGPVTLTDPNMTRYFMLIPEAVSLVLMSSTLSQPGDINVLKMGEPLKIVDLAKSLMALMGKSEGEVGIVFTGARPGEKMFEELSLTGDEIFTRHPDIMTLPRGDIHGGKGSEGLWHHVERLLELAHRNDPSVKGELQALIHQHPRASELHGLA